MVLSPVPGLPFSSVYEPVGTSTVTSFDGSFGVTSTVYSPVGLPCPSSFGVTVIVSILESGVFLMRSSSSFSVIGLPVIGSCGISLKSTVKSPVVGS